MKVIQKGNKQPRVFVTKCRNCDSEIEAQEVELNWEHDPRGDPLLARKKCPECKHEIFFYQRP